MRCPQCKKEVVADSLFCHKCGERLDEHDPAINREESEAAAETPMEKFQQVAASRMDAKAESEHELWRGDYSPKAMVGNWVASGFAGILLLVVAIVWLRPYPLWFWLVFAAAFAPAVYNLAVLLYRKMSVHYILTNQRFIHESGIFRRVTNRIEVLDMDDVSFEQTLVERMFGIGSIRILSSDRSTPDLVLKGIENVAEVSNLLDDTRRTERRKRGLHIENI